MAKELTRGCPGRKCRFVARKLDGFADFLPRFNGNIIQWGSSQVGLVVKNLPANAEVVRDSGSIPGSGRSPEGGHGNPLQCSCLENPMDRGAWWAAVREVAKTRTRLKRLSTQYNTGRQLYFNLKQ